MDNQTTQPAPQLYGVSNTSVNDVNKTFVDRLHDRFEPTDFVRVINPDDETFYWQSMNPSKEAESNVGRTGHYIQRDLPDMYGIQPGETKVLQGWNAYIMIEQLYKKLSQKEVIASHPEGKNIEGKPVDLAFAWYDDNKQQKYIDMILIGIETPEFDRGGVSPTPQIIETPSVAPNNLPLTDKEVYEKSLADLGLKENDNTDTKKTTS